MHADEFPIVTFGGSAGGWLEGHMSSSPALIGLPPYWRLLFSDHAKHAIFLPFTVFGGIALFS
jgi:hypothetical protein